MIDGLKLTISGGELRTLLEERIRRHEQRVDWWTHEQTRAGDDADAPQLPEHICRNEAERHTWRADVLRFVRDHVAAGETYYLGAADLEFGELLPAKPDWLAQDEYEERVRPAATLGDLTKALDRIVGTAYGMLRRHDSPPVDEETERTENGNDFSITHLHPDGGPEVVVIKRTPPADCSGDGP